MTINEDFLLENKIQTQLNNFFNFESVYNVDTESNEWIFVESIWNNYAKAMSKRRVGSELPLENFYRYVTEQALFLNLKIVMFLEWLKKEISFQLILLQQD